MVDMISPREFIIRKIVASYDRRGIVPTSVSTIMHDRFKGAWVRAVGFY